MSRADQPPHIRQVSTQNFPISSVVDTRHLDGPATRAFLRFQRFNARLERHREALSDWRRVAERGARRLAAVEPPEPQDVVGTEPSEDVPASEPAQVFAQILPKKKILI